MAETTRVENAERRFLVALAMERIGMGHAVQGAAEELLDALTEGDDPLSEMLRESVRRPSVLRVAFESSITPRVIAPEGDQ